MGFAGGACNGANAPRPETMGARALPAREGTPLRPPGDPWRNV